MIGKKTASAILICIFNRRNDNLQIYRHTQTHTYTPTPTPTQTLCHMQEVKKMWGLFQELFVCGVYFLSEAY